MILDRSFEAPKPQHNEKKKNHFFLKGSETICKVNNANRDLSYLKFLSCLPQDASSCDIIIIITQIP